jgi:uncharacterized membrane protein YeaQ/YmgE (transglycosylase-associated protein family)
MFGMWLLWEILIGILAGWIASQLVKGRGLGLLMDLVLGVVGSILGGFVFAAIGIVALGLIGRLVMSIVGAVLLLLLVRAIKRA